MGYIRVYMPTIFSYLESKAFRPKRYGAQEKGQVFNTFTTKGEEPDVIEKEGTPPTHLEFHRSSVRYE